VGVELVAKGFTDGMEADPLIAGVTISLELLLGCSPNRRSAAFKVASRVSVGSRGSAVVESVDSDSVREPELVSEAEEVESEADVVVGRRIAGTEVSLSGG